MLIVADENIAFVENCFSSIGRVKLLPGRSISADSIAGADCLLVRSVTKVDRDLLKRSKVKFVGTATIGYEHIDVEYLRKRGIGFASAPGSNANSVAEYLIAGLLSVAGKYNIILQGSSIGIIGAGNIGSKVAKKCVSLGMKVVLNDPPLKRNKGAKNYRPIEELFDCDFVTLHTPLTLRGKDKTHHLANEEFFRSLKKGTVFINTSRGGVADTQALKLAIKRAKLKAAILDVWENEPNIDTELCRLADISTPHIAGYSLDGKVNGTIMIKKAACQYFGIQETSKAKDFLPEPDVPTIQITGQNKKEQEIIKQTVERIYSIRRDDYNMREILNKQNKEKNKLFDTLRDDYPVRREFPNTRVVLKAENRHLAKKLEGIGFKVSYHSDVQK